MKLLAIKGFRTFQHYHKRGAPWIKLYSSILSDTTFLELPEAAQAQLMKLWVLASQMGHPLPNNPKLLAGRIGTLGKFHLDAIIAAGFIIPCNESASTGASEPDSTTLAPVLADRSQHARASAHGRERREERVERSEKETTSSSSADSAIATRLASDADRRALAVVLQAAPNAATWAAEMAASLDAMPGHVALTPIQLGEALRDYVGNDGPATARLKHFRTYMQRAAITAPSRAHARTRDDDAYQHTHDVLDEMIAREKAKVANG